MSECNKVASRVPQLLPEVIRILLRSWQAFMNKAFVKEIDDPGDHCPVCSSVGMRVHRLTLESQLTTKAVEKFTDSAYFCVEATCEVAYFDQFEQMVTVDQLQRPVYPKDPQAPICPCFGFTCEEIEADIAESGVARVRKHVERAQSDKISCEIRSPHGRSCVPAVQKYYMRRRGEGAS